MKLESLPFFWGHEELCNANITKEIIIETVRRILIINLAVIQNRKLNETWYLGIIKQYSYTSNFYR